MISIISDLYQKGEIMSNLDQCLDELMAFDGALCAAVVDYNSGMLLASKGDAVDMELAAAGNTEVVRAKLKTMKSLGLNDQIEDFLITLGKQYHILRPSEKAQGIFLYYVLDTKRANLALARRKVTDVSNKVAL